MSRFLFMARMMSIVRMKFLWGYSTLVLAAGLCCQGAALDFEQVLGRTPVEGTRITNQFQSYYGVRFTGFRSNDVPVIAKRGFPSAAFDTNFGDDEIDPEDPRSEEVGDFFLTVQGPGGYPWGIKLLFDTPLTNISFLLMDLDYREAVRTALYSSHSDNVPIATSVHANNSTDGYQPRDRGNGNTTFVSLSDTNRNGLFSKVEITVDRNSNIGGNIGFDRFVFGHASPRIEPSSKVGYEAHVAIKIEGIVGWPYRIEYANKIESLPLSTNWLPLTNLYLPASPYFVYDVDGPRHPQRIYRAVAEP